MRARLWWTLMLLVSWGLWAERSLSHASGIAPPAIKTTEELYSPFAGTARCSFKGLNNRTISRFGVSRATPRSGHRHSGIDLVGTLGEKVYAIGPGKVVRHYWIFPNLALAVEHRLPDGSVFYSAYVHLADPRVQVGDAVDEHTVLGRLFNQKEMGRSRFRTPHLHLEIRKNFDDDGRASFTTMTVDGLQQYFYNPLNFIKSYMK